MKIVEEKHYDKEYPLRDASYFLGYCGMWALFTGPLVLYGCDQLGWEHFDFPPDKASLWIMVEICIMDVVLNLGICLAITIKSPYFMSMGLLLIIPGSFLADSYLGKIKAPIGWIQIVGIFLIVSGFLVLQLRTGSNSVLNSWYCKAQCSKKSDSETRLAEESLLTNGQEPLISTFKRF